MEAKSDFISIVVAHYIHGELRERQLTCSHSTIVVVDMSIGSRKCDGFVSEKIWGFRDTKLILFFHFIEILYDRVSLVHFIFI